MPKAESRSSVETDWTTSDGIILRVCLYSLSGGYQGTFEREGSRVWPDQFDCGLSMRVKNQGSIFDPAPEQYVWEYVGPEVQLWWDPKKRMYLCCGWPNGFSTYDRHLITEGTRGYNGLSERIAANRQSSQPPPIDDGILQIANLDVPLFDCEFEEVDRWSSKDNGLEVMKVGSDGLGRRFGLQPGDIVVEIEREKATLEKLDTIKERMINNLWEIFDIRIKRGYEYWNFILNLNWWMPPALPVDESAPWVVSSIYFCDTEKDAELLSAIRDTNDMFDYGYGHDYHTELEDEPVIIHRPITPDDEADMGDEKEVICLEEVVEGFEKILAEGAKDEEWIESIQSALNLIRDRITDGQKEISFSYISGE